MLISSLTSATLARYSTALAISLALASPAAQASELGPVLGGGLGAVAGAVIGHSVGGRNGAVIGAAVGGATGVLVGQSVYRERERNYHPPRYDREWQRGSYEREDFRHEDRGRHRGWHRHHHHHGD